MGKIRFANCTRVEQRVEFNCQELLGFRKASRLGIDVGYTGNKTLTWAVFGVDGKSNKGLKGTYTGVNAEATALVGVGANALIGGFNSGIVLNPVSVSTQTGINVAAGVASFTLH